MALVKSKSAVASAIGIGLGAMLFSSLSLATETVSGVTTPPSGPLD